MQEIASARWDTQGVLVQSVPWVTENGRMRSVFHALAMEMELSLDLQTRAIEQVVGVVYKLL